ncbi:MAG: ribonuclease P protein component [wastewater metagenome]|nr:ribonuclease P protein component [Candidatus Loosdrechtia aerotolerans]
MITSFLMSFRFTRAEHLTLNREFEQVFHEGKVLKNDAVVLYVIPNNLQHSRLGLVVSKKKIGNAVRRNRAKRLLREAYRLNKHVLTVHVDIIAIPRQVFSSDINLSYVENKLKDLLIQINRKFSYTTEKVLAPAGFTHPNK